ncbi:MAG: histidine phosphatase family protein [Candidatus Pacebacteria bacterium]|nr:histidine phosphatase family protein [Candidatus Paceibacterota bacterium]
MKHLLLTSPLNTYYHVRHGQTDLNLEKKYQGTSDYPLNENGINQAARVKLDQAPDLVFSSPFKRSTRTAEIITGITPNHDSRINEKDGGEIEGWSYDKIFKNYPEIKPDFNNPLEDLLSIHLPSGESDLDVIKRLHQFIYELEETHKGKCIYIFGHYGTGVAMRYIFGKTKEEIFKHVENCNVEKLS